jgi:hypothetical protein
VKHEDIVWVPVHNSDENISAVVEGRADICFNMPISRHVQEASKNPLGLDMVDLNAEQDPEGARRFRERDPLVSFGPVPKESLAMIAGRWGTQGLNLELTNAREPAEQVYHIAKWLDENHLRYKDRHRENRFRTRQWLMKALEETFVPVHEGLKMYLKDLGLWTEKHERRDRKNLDTLTRYVDSYQRLMWAADDAGMEVRPENEKWVQLWENYRDAYLPPIKLHNGLEEDA